MLLGTIPQTKPPISTATHNSTQDGAKACSEEDLIDTAAAHTKEHEYDAALKIYFPLADKGNLKAHSAIAQLCARGNFKINYGELCEAAEKGSPAALFFIGHSHYQENECRTAKPYFKQSHEKGYAMSTYMLGLMNSRGEGVPRDRQKAINYLIEANEKGVPEAYPELQTLLLERRQKVQEALSWF